MRMRAAVLRVQGAEPPFTESRPLTVEEVAIEEPGPGEVLVRIEAAGLCHSDLSAITGERPRAVPAVAGHEAAGVVAAVGPGVEGLGPGDHVVMVFVAACGACGFCIDGRPNLCEGSWTARATGTLQTGARRLHSHGEALNHWSGISAFAQYAVVVPGSVVRIDPEIPLDHAAVFGCAVMTGVGAVVNTARVPVGATVAVVGLGGVGLSAVLGAAAAGASRIIAVDTNPAKLELAGCLGATDVVDARDPDAAASVRARLGGGVQFAIEAAGVAPAVELAWEMTGRGGTTVTAGLPPPSHQLAVPLSALVADERVLRGSYMGSCVARRDIPRYLDLYRRGKLPVDRLLSGTVSLDGLNAGFDRLARGETVRDVLLPWGEVTT
jgi:Zn-dependent alcohol dehydrogenase